jgi:lipoprotein-releasing system permease protein
LIGIAGTALGIVFGLVIATNIAWIVALIEQVLGFRFLAPDVYFISDFPSRVRVSDVVEIASIALLLAFVSTVYPAWRAAILAPAQALRHE